MDPGSLVDPGDFLSFLSSLLLAALDRPLMRGPRKKEDKLWRESRPPTWAYIVGPHCALFCYTLEEDHVTYLLFNR